MDNAKFCSNSCGSCWEVLDHLITATDEELIPPETLATGRDLVNTAVKLINGYMSYLRRASERSGVREPIGEYVYYDEQNLERPQTTEDQAKTATDNE